MLCCVGRLALLLFAPLSVSFLLPVAGSHQGQEFHEAAGSRIRLQNPHKHEVHCSRERSRAAWEAIDEYLMPFVEKEKYELPSKCRLRSDNDMIREQEQHKIHFDINDWRCGFCKKAFRAEQFLDQHFENRHNNLVDNGITYSELQVQIAGQPHRRPRRPWQPCASSCSPGRATWPAVAGCTTYGRWDGVVPPECAPDPSVLRLTAALQWEEAREPLHADIDTTKTCGVGPGMSFARAALPSVQEGAGSAPGAAGPGGGARIGLVPCAVGGTAIREWARGEQLYEQMIRRARAAAGYGAIEAVLWYQGESDATAAYRENVERLIANVRADLGMPQLAFIQVALASGYERNVEKVRSAQFSVNLPNVVTVDAMGLALNEDNIHLTTKSQEELGKMLAEAYINNFFTATC